MKEEEEKKKKTNEQNPDAGGRRDPRQATLKSPDTEACPSAREGDDIPRAHAADAFCASHSL